MAGIMGEKEQKSEFLSKILYVKKKWYDIIQ